MGQWCLGFECCVHKKEKTRFLWHLAVPSCIIPVSCEAEVSDWIAERGVGELSFGAGAQQEAVRRTQIPPLLCAVMLLLSFLHAPR